MKAAASVTSGRTVIRIARPSTSSLGRGTLTLSAVALFLAGGSSCHNGGSAGGEVEVVSALVSTASLQLKVLTNSCGANQMQDFFQVTNTGTATVKLSDIKIKFWADDTSGQTLAPHVATGGCVSGPNGSPSCAHQVAGATAVPTSFSPACGPDAAHQANWEITISDTDGATLPPSATWNNLQTSVNLANFSNFNPGTGKWFSGCLSGSSYVSDPHFALYYQGTLVFSNGLSAPDCRAPHGTQPITSYTPPPAAPVIGPAPGNQVISLAVGLPVSNNQLAQLQALANQVSDPTSPSYRKYIGTTNLIATYSPSIPTYNQVVAWAQGRGFTRVGTYPNRMMISVTATVAAVEAAFHANVILASRPDGSQFYRLDRQPSVDLAVPLLGVSGLDNYLQPKLATGTAPLGGYQPSDLRSAYLGEAACAALDGSGQSIGIFGFNSGFDPNDVAQFRSRTHLPAGLPVQVFSGDDPTNPAPTPAVPDGNGGELELTLDLEAAIAIAPQAQIVTFEGRNFDATLELMANNPSISQLSSSFSGVTSPIMATTLAVMAAQGQSFFVASGDSGAYQPPTMPTTACPTNILALAAQGFVDGLDASLTDLRAQSYVTLVGGTTLLTDPMQQWAGELSWVGGAQQSSGGGIIPGLAIPSYQVGANPNNADVSNTLRNVPDVALLADSMYVVTSICDLPGHTGGNTGQSGPGGVLIVPCPAGHLKGAMDALEFGTSVASPMWAGVMALVNQQAKAQSLAPVGFANPAIYQIGKNPVRNMAAFRDTIGRNNTNICGFGYTTSSGYDLTTGWGTPRCGLVAALNGAPPFIPVGVTAGDGHACSVRSDGSVRCWGNNAFGQLGVPPTTTPSGPVTVVGLPTLATKVVAGLAHTCARLTDGTVACWGSNQAGQLGQQLTITGSSTPMIVRGPAGTSGPLSGVIDIAAGTVHTCALVVNQGVFCWGDNTFGQLGTQPTNPANAQSAFPLAVTGLQSSAIAVAAGAFHSCAKLITDAAQCWGDNDSGQLGVPSATANLQIAPPFITAGVVSLAGTRGSTCALLAGGGVKCAGNDTLLGIGVVDGLPHPAPVDVHGLSNVGLLSGALVVAAGADHTCAILPDGSIDCWGVNTFGQLGDATASDGGSTENGYPTAVVGLSASASAVAAGNGFTCAALADGTVVCWGDNSSGQLGGGTSTPQTGKVVVPL
jgi:alpha-tubulin suppressor-like RCC1 family protein